MAISTISYSANTAIAMDLSALGSSATYVAGRESTEIDNTTNKYVDAIVQGRFIVGTTPAATGGLAVYVWGADTSLVTTAFDVLDGLDSAETLTNSTVLGALKLASFIPVLAATTNVTYPIRPFAVAQLFGGIMPKFWGIYTSQSTGVALKVDAGNTNSLSFNGIKYDVI